MRSLRLYSARLDLAPPLANRFIVEAAPIDYGLVLLLMPFGSHLAVDSRARLTQVMNLLLLAPDIREKLLFGNWRPKEAYDQ